MEHDQNIICELIDLSTSCGIQATHMACIVDHCVSERHIQRCIKNKKPPSSALHRAVIEDILMALRYAYATKKLPLVSSSTDYGTTRPEQLRGFKAAKTNTLKESLNDARTLLTAGGGR